jgi:hypothetical protein
MGASAREIERQIKETRDRMDGNLTRLEGQTASSARRYGVIAGAVAGVALLAGAAFLVHRRMHRPTLRDRLSELSLDDLRSLAGRLRDATPSVTLRVNEKTDEEPGTAAVIVRKVAPALMGTAGSALLQRLVPPPEDDYSAQAE